MAHRHLRHVQRLCDATLEPALPLQTQCLETTPLPPILQRAFRGFHAYLMPISKIKLHCATISRSEMASANDAMSCRPPLNHMLWMACAATGPPSACGRGPSVFGSGALARRHAAGARSHNTRRVVSCFPPGQVISISSDSETNCGGGAAAGPPRASSAAPRPIGLAGAFPTAAAPL